MKLCYIKKKNDVEENNHCDGNKLSNNLNIDFNPIIEYENNKR